MENSFGASDPIHFQSPPRFFPNPFNTSPSRPVLPTHGMATIPSSPVESKFDWDRMHQGSTPDWRGVSFPELTEEEDPEYNPEAVEEDEEEPGSDDHDDATVQDDFDQFDLQELLKDAQQDMILPKPLMELMAEDDDDDTEYEPIDDEDDGAQEEPESEEEDAVYDPSEFDLEELLKDAEQEVPILPKPLTEMIEDMTSDDEEYKPDDHDDEDDDDDDDEDDLGTEDNSDPLDFDLDALLRDAQRDMLNPYTPLAQELAVLEEIQKDQRKSLQKQQHPGPSPGVLQERSQNAVTPAAPKSLRELLAFNRDNMKIQRDIDHAPPGGDNLGLLSNVSVVLNSRISATPTSTSPSPVPEDDEKNKMYDKAPHNAGFTTNDIGVEVHCEYCERVFRGPKASTHKQQHIKRLHPENYVRKKGGRVPNKKPAKTVWSTAKPIRLQMGQKHHLQQQHNHQDQQHQQHQQHQQTNKKQEQALAPPPSLRHLLQYPQ
ncbi:CYFA0S02e06546g1_1 [Cyberlindnera fabianii]|uniref:CYFA0S02e06546g1_1 n=1 Tax=Cyberlindnera fabianii TaxID=36022 RepID=A0A061AMJ4_CYBFA|nr:CYFA0S02e06546g1_1 [Cyberlindnera fabianii]